MQYIIRIAKKRWKFLVKNDQSFFSLSSFMLCNLSNSFDLSRYAFIDHAALKVSFVILT